MTTCFNQGQLRAYLDRALPDLEQAAIAHHLGTCSRCRGELAELTAVSGQAATLLMAKLPDAKGALARFQAQSSTQLEQSTEGNTLVEHQRVIRPRRSWFAALGAVLVVLALFALPPVRAAADSLLQIFRVQQVVFVPVSDERAAQLKSLNFDGDSLFLQKPDFKDTKPQDVPDAAAASSAAGFTVAEPSELPGPATANTYQVAAAQTGSFQVNVASARQLLELLDIKDVTIPDALGAQPIAVTTKPIASAEYRGDGYRVTLTQGASPELALPDGVELSQLGNALLQILGTPADQAKTMAANIDWSSTLVVPMPSDIDSVEQVTVNGGRAMLVRESHGKSDQSMIYWQRGDRFYVLEATGLDDAELIVAAESVK